MNIYLSLGSNQGARWANLKEALWLLGERLDVVDVSSVYETEPVDVGDQSRFLNMICRVGTDIEPRELLSLVKDIEARMGRDLSLSNAPRVIDIDIILYGDQVIDTPDLTIPHKKMAQRAFVLVPLAEIAPRTVDPVTGQRVEDLASDVEGKEGVIKVEGV
jgi:2-amino-4-hydroxy-6-hydroxymethyldihydropteridine diphosphokinase